MSPDEKVYVCLGNRKKRVICWSISRCGGCLVVTSACHRSEEGFCITHTLTGQTITGSNISSTVKEAKTLARKFWRLLNADQKKIWSESDSPKAVIECTPEDARLLVQGKEY